MALAAASVVLALFSSGEAKPVATQVFTAAHDAYVLQGSPTTVGNDAHLRARKTSSSNAHSYLKFEVTGLSGPPSAAKLRLHVTDASPNAGPVVTAANTTPAGSPWSETSLTWNTKPALGASALSSVGAVAVGTWVEYDLKSVIAGNGTYTFALTGGSSDPAWFSSAEGANPPQLVVTPGGPPPPPAPPIADFTASPRSGIAALTLQFSDASSGAPNTWAWDFQSDGTIDSTAQSPQFTYAGPGTYDVTLQVENSLGSDVETKLGYVTVSAGTGPTNTSPPLISAVATERSALHARPGTWTGTLPITHTYQWQRCDSTGAGCTDIPDATSRRYSLTETDVGATLQVTVTATNSGGSGSASSAVSGIVPARPALPPGDPVIGVVGDIACPPNEATTATACRQRYTSDLAVDAGLTAILVPGDIQYNRGEYENFLASYDPTWGRVNGITYPAPGNHEYTAGAAPGYFQYFGPVAGDPTKGYYSVDIGTWHVIALNSNCAAIGGCGAGSAQEQWLRADLAAHPATCTLGYWHHPRFSSGDHGSAGSMQALWQALYDANADVVLSGHDHNYERFAPQTATGTSDPERGIREFVVGTGGRGLRPFRTPIANSEIRNATTFGILKLTLHASGYDWQFVPEAGKTFTDTGIAAACH
ncbi:MAG TPA: DNRLRE domain-containing protein [Gaiellaceae bacterium]|nr:DNRLRE domain-containing protein [Gaiellaceae bacterium]